MPRLLGVEIPAKKKIGFALRYIYGIGPARADQIVADGEDGGVDQGQGDGVAQGGAAGAG